MISFKIYHFWFVWGFFCFFNQYFPGFFLVFSWFFLEILEDSHPEKSLFGFGRDWRDFLVDITNRKNILREFSIKFASKNEG